MFETLIMNEIVLIDLDSSNNLLKKSFYQKNILYY